MSGIIQRNHKAGTCAFPMGTRTVKRTASGGFLDIAARMADTVETSGTLENVQGPETDSVDAYLERLKAKYGRVTIESISKDQRSLEAAGRRMNGHDVVIAPNILEDMASDWKTAAYYEQKIDDFFSATPRLKAYFAAQGLTYEPCGVVVHEDGSITYICGGGDSPERVAEVNRINREKAKEKAAQQKLYQEQAAAAALERRTFRIGDLMRARIASAPTGAAAPEISLPSDAALFFLDL